MTAFFWFPSRLEMVATVVEVLIGKRGGVGWGGCCVVLIETRFISGER